MTLRHTCHATGCTVAVPPKMFMCRQHWFALPKMMRDGIWAEYVPGQEVRKDPTDEYLDIAQRCVAYLEERESWIEQQNTIGVKPLHGSSESMRRRKVTP